MIPTCEVTCIVYDQSGNPEVGAKVHAKLTGYNQYNGYVIPELISGVTDESGQCTLSLWPNALGPDSSTYTVTVISDNGKRFRVMATVPNVETALLHDISGPPEPA